jgi:hypothetical protein
MAEAKGQKTVSMEFLRDKHREKVKGIFKYDELPGGTLEFVFKEFKDDPTERYELRDGQVYSLPLGVVKHLKQNGWIPVNKHAMDENGRPSIELGMKKKRFSFNVLDFIDIEELSGPSELITVKQL